MHHGLYTIHKYMHVHIMCALCVCVKCMHMHLHCICALAPTLVEHKDCRCICRHGMHTMGCILSTKLTSTKLMYCCNGVNGGFVLGHVHIHIMHVCMCLLCCCACACCMCICLSNSFAPSTHMCNHTHEKGILKQETCSATKPCSADI